MKIVTLALLAVGLCLVVIMLNGLWSDESEALAPPAPPPTRPVPMSAALPNRLVTPLPKPVESKPAVRCETTPVSGSHTSRAEREARQGALEDVADICPVGKVVPTQLRCGVVDGEQGIMGYPSVKCVQQAVCTLCGDDLARKLEVAQ